jgi:hypothetical protein
LLPLLQWIYIYIYIYIYYALSLHTRYFIMEWLFPWLPITTDHLDYIIMHIVVSLISYCALDSIFNAFFKICKITDEEFSWFCIVFRDCSLKMPWHCYSLVLSHHRTYLLSSFIIVHISCHHSS